MSDFYRVWGRRATDVSFQYDYNNKEAALGDFFAFVEYARLNKTQSEIEADFDAAMEAGGELSYSCNYAYMSASKITKEEFKTPEEYLEANLQMMGYYDED